MFTSYALRLCAAFLLATALFTPRAHAQLDDNLSLYGFFQTGVAYSDERITFGPMTIKDHNLSFSVQQLNLFLAKQFNPSLSTFVNTEIRNTLSTADGFGDLRLEEAWLRYNHSGAFNLKAGRLVPRFNNLNEIKNRTPLLPYISRPIIYESSLHEMLPMEQFVPDHAYVQAYGTLPTGSVRFDYAAYVGNGESSYLARRTDGMVVAGTDTSLAKVVGGRVGARWRGFQAGVSGTYDQRYHSDIAAFDNPTAPIPGTGLGDLPRTRLGADLSFTISRLFGEAEAIQVRYRFDDAQQAQITDNMANFLMLSESMDASFYYALLGVNITDRVFAYGRLDHLGDESADLSLNVRSVGGGFRPIDPVVLKAQYLNVATPEDGLFGLSIHYLFGSVSVSF